MRHPGSTHDSVIFERSALRARLELNQIPGRLLGDNGYPCKRYLLTPFLEPNNEAERRYNNAHKQTRIIVERLFGILKRKFSCLNSVLRTKLENTTVVILACAVLYNIGIKYNQNNDLLEEDEIIHDQFVDVEIQNDLGGLAFRAAFVQRHF